jgi:3-oxoacyl-[acyl-carrier-protein] synthase-3
MEHTGLKCGLVFTCDPYSKIVDPADKNTGLIFGDAATVTLMTEEPELIIGKSAFFTDGSQCDALAKREGEFLKMDGRRVFNFVMKRIPRNVEECLKLNGIDTLEQVCLFLFHQASKYLIDNLVKRMGLDASKAPFMISDYGNTVSSSLPILLGEFLFDRKFQRILLSGFGVGLSAASVVLRRRE